MSSHTCYCVTDAETEQLESDSTHTDTDTEGIEVLAAANYQTFDDICKEMTDDSDTAYTTLRSALGHFVDSDLSTAADEYDVPATLLVNARDECYNTATELYPEFLA